MADAIAIDGSFLLRRHIELPGFDSIGDQGKQMEISRLLRSLEEELLRPEVRRDLVRVAALLTDNFCEVGTSGSLYSKNDVLTALLREKPSIRSLDEFRTELLQDDVALVTYRVYKHADEAAPTVSRHCSVWVRQSGEWRVRFHQGTPL